MYGVPMHCPYVADQKNYLLLISSENESLIYSMLVNGGPCTPSLTVGELEPLHPLLFAHFLGAPEQKQNT